MQKIVVATANLGKLREFHDLLSASGFEVLAQSDFQVSSVDETGTTFVENAIIKARHAARETGLAAIADDSGLEVDALAGRPGIYSARYSGEGATDATNNHKLLNELCDVPYEQRKARYHAVLAYMRHADDPTPILCHGVWQGFILTAPRGESGFGYDPLFFIPDLNCTAAELKKEEKNKISHRGKAMRELLLRIKHMQLS